jgi:hypothetical protein
MKAKRRKAPILWDNLPEAQRQGLRLLGHALDNLEYYANCFEAALKLYDYCAESTRGVMRPRAANSYREWQFIAARDGALSIDHFFEAMSALGQSLRECRTYHDAIDQSVLREAKKKFLHEFKDYLRVRHSVTHAAEKTANSQKHSVHGYTGVWSTGRSKHRVKGFVVIDSLVRRKYSNTWNGRIVSYRLSKRTFGKLCTVRDMIFDAVDAASNHVSVA